MGNVFCVVFFVRSMILFLVVLLLGWVLVCRRHVVGAGGRDVSGVGVVGVVPAKGIKNLRFWVEDLKWTRHAFPYKLLLNDYLSISIKLFFICCSYLGKMIHSSRKQEKTLFHDLRQGSEKPLPQRGGSKNTEWYISHCYLKIGCEWPLPLPPPYRVAKI